MCTNRITFGEGELSLADYYAKNWSLNESQEVEFFKGSFTRVTLISSTNASLPSYLKSIDDGWPMALDLEWKYDDEFTDHPLAIVQIASSKGVLVIRNKSNSKHLHKFLGSHSFFGKGCNTDRRKLLKAFGPSFRITLEDVEKTRLVPYGYSTNFNEMVRIFAGNPTAEFKDKKVTLSNWESPELSKLQVLYAAFDAVALYRAYEWFQPAITPTSYVAHVISKKATSSFVLQLAHRPEPIIL